MELLFNIAMAIALFMLLFLIIFIGFIGFMFIVVDVPPETKDLTKEKWKFGYRQK